MTANRDDELNAQKTRLAAGNSVTQTAAQRSRELGYADAMLEVWEIVRELEKNIPLYPLPQDIAGLDPDVAFTFGAASARRPLAMLGTYAFDAYYLHMEPGKDTTRHVDYMARYPASSYGTARPELPKR